MGRYNLYMFRCSQKLTKTEMAQKIGVNRMTYSYIEDGKRFGNAEFWDNLQAAFSVPDEEMRKLQRTDERG